jgi:hypothetical protein
MSLPSSIVLMHVRLNIWQQNRLWHVKVAWIIVSACLEHEMRTKCILTCLAKYLKAADTRVLNIYYLGIPMALHSGTSLQCSPISKFQQPGRMVPSPYYRVFTVLMKLGNTSLISMNFGFVQDAEYALDVQPIQQAEHCACTSRHCVADTGQYWIEHHQSCRHIYHKPSSLY